MYPVKTILATFLRRPRLKGFVVAAALLVPAIAQAASGFATANVNMRSGPSTRYPAVVVIPAGAPVEIHGCLSGANWCDVSFSRGRGWVSGTYVQAIYRQNRVYVAPQYYRPLGIPTVTFDIGTYWDRNYRNRDFYRDRDYWRGGPDRYERDRDRGRFIRERERERDRFMRDPDRDRPNPDRPRFDRNDPRFDRNDPRFDRNDPRFRRDDPRFDRNPPPRVQRDDNRGEPDMRDRNGRYDNPRDYDRRNAERNDRRDQDRRDMEGNRDRERDRNRDGNRQDRRQVCGPDDPVCQ